MAGKIDKGMSILNATDEVANPYGLILSEKERDAIYRGLTRLDNMRNAVLYGRTGWKQQTQAVFSTLVECAGAIIVADAFHLFLNTPTVTTIMFGLAFLVLQKLNLLLTHEKIQDTHERQHREDEKERKERAQYFKDMGVKDLSLEE